MRTDPARAAVAFEWTKIRTLPSTVWSLGLFLGLSLGVAVLVALIPRDEGEDSAAGTGFDPVAIGLGGVRFAMIVLVVFAVLTVTSEYSTGTIRSSLTAVPHRGVLYAAKILVGSATVAGASVVAVAVSFPTAQAVLGGGHDVSLTDPGVARALVGAVLHVTLICAFSMGLAGVLRGSAVTIGILCPLFVTASTILSNIAGIRRVAQFLPDVAGGIILRREPPAHTVLTAWTGMAVMLAWTAASVTAGYLVFRRRDV